MSEAHCSSCGAVLSAETSPRGLCPACLLKLGLSDSSIRVDELPPLPQAQTNADARTTKTIRRLPRWAWIVALGIFLVVAALWAALNLRPTERNDNPFQFTFYPAGDSEFIGAEGGGDFAISPDGRRLTFTARGPEGNRLLWIHPLDGFVDQPLSGTEDAAFPFWSPDSQSVAFFAQGKLKTINVANGRAITLCDAPDAYGGTWGPDGVILFASHGIHRVSARGGEVTPVAGVEDSRPWGSHRWPRFLPDGRLFLYSIVGDGPGPEGLYVASLSSGETRQIVDSRSSAEYASGHLLFVRDRTLLAQPFDSDSAEFRGEPRPIQDNVEETDGQAAFSASQNGVIVYRTGGNSTKRLVWIDGSGRHFRAVDAAADFREFSLSRDGRFVAVAIRDERAETTDLWVIDLARNVRSRFTFDPAQDYSPLWSPDGSEIAFLSNREKPNGIYRKRVNTAELEVLLYRSERLARLESWSTDGRVLLYREANATSDLVAMPAVGDAKALPVIQTNFEERAGKFSPDGRWIAYQSNESGRFEIFVRSFPASEVKWQITANGGTNPEWRPDGRELFYIAPEGTLMSVAIQSRASSFEIGMPRALFPLQNEAYQAAPDGRFLVLMPTEEARSRPIQFIINWVSLSRRQ